MIRFLPEKNKKDIKIEYFSRVFVLALIFLIALGVFGVFSIFPSYITSYFRDISIESQYKFVRQNKIDVSEQEKTVKVTNDILNVLSQFQDQKPSISMLNILAKKNDGVSISLVSFIKEKVGYKFTIRGIAKTRESLLDFVKDLKSEKTLSGVNLPVSDYVKSTDIEFSLTVISK